MGQSILDAVSTPEARQASAETQSLRRESQSNKLAQTPAQANFRFAQARLESLQHQLKAATFGDRVYLAVAECCAIQGRFDDAAKTLPEGPQRALYEAKAAAIRNLDVQRCACPPTVRRASKTDAKGTEETTQQPVDDIWDGERNFVVARCSLCGTYSAYLGSAMPGVINKQAENRAESDKFNG